MKTITVTIAVLFASCALYAQHSGGLVERLKRSDTNGDGKIDDGERAAIRELIRKRWQRPQSTTPLPPASLAAERLIEPIPHVEFLPSQEEIVAWIERLCGQGIRRAGHPADQWTEKFIGDQFKEWGLRDIVFQPVPVRTWHEGETRFVVTAGGKTTELTAFPSVLVKDATRVEAPLIKYEGDAQLDKVANAIVVVDYTLGEISPAPLLDKAVFVHDPDRSLSDSRHIIGMPQPRCAAGRVFLAGVPVVGFISGPSVYYFDAQDTPDKVDREGLVPITRAMVRVIQATKVQTADTMRRVGVASKTGPQSPDTKSDIIAFTGVNVLPMTSETVFSDHTVIVDRGWVQANYFNSQAPDLQAEPASLLDSKIAANELHSPLLNEKRDFLDAVKSRGATLADAEVGQRTASLGHLGHIAIQLGRKLSWDPGQERCNDDEADRLLSRPPGRAPWAI